MARKLAVALWERLATGPGIGRGTGRVWPTAAPRAAPGLLFAAASTLAILPCCGDVNFLLESPREKSAGARSVHAKRTDPRPREFGNPECGGGGLSFEGLQHEISAVLIAKPAKPKLQALRSAQELRTVEFCCQA